MSMAVILLPFALQTKLLSSGGLQSPTLLNNLMYNESMEYDLNGLILPE